MSSSQWECDTCGCVYTFDDDVPHPLTARASKCAAHAHMSDDAAFADTRAENAAAADLAELIERVAPMAAPLLSVGFDSALAPRGIVLRGLSRLPVAHQGAIMTDVALSPKARVRALRTE